MITSEQKRILLEWLRLEDRSAIYDLLIRFPPASTVRSDGTYLYPSKTNVGLIASYTEDGQVSVLCNDWLTGVEWRGYCDPIHLEIVRYSATPDEMRSLIAEVRPS